MGKKTYCNVYEDDKLIMEHVTQREIADRLNFSANKVWHSLGSRNKLDGKYTIEILEEVPQKTFEERWNEVVAPFARVQWSKTEGRSLEIGEYSDEKRLFKDSCKRK